MAQQRRCVLGDGGESALRVVGELLEPAGRGPEPNSPKRNGGLTFSVPGASWVAGGLPLSWPGLVELSAASCRRGRRESVWPAGVLLGGS